MKTILDFKGTTAFLNGEAGLHDMDEELLHSFTEHGLPTLVLDNLFERKSRLNQLTECKNVVLFTTGIRPEELRPLVHTFAALDYTPDNVIFLSEGTALAFIGIARELKKRGTQFFFVDIIDNKTLFPINWI